MICQNTQILGFGVEFRVHWHGTQMQHHFFWKCALRKTPAAIPPRLGYAYSQLLV